MWVQVFNTAAGGHEWPSDLPKPSYDNETIRVPDIRFEDVKACLELLGERVAAVDAEIERGEPEREQERQRVAARKAEISKKRAEAEQAIDEFFT